VNLTARDDEGTVFGHLVVPDDAKPEQVERIGLEAYATYQAKKLGIDPALAHGLIQSESDWKQDAVGPTTKTGDHAIGLMQLMPKTAAGYGVDPRNPYANIRAGMQVLQDRLHRYPDVDTAIASYKGWNVEEHGGVVPPFRKAQEQVDRARQASAEWAAKQGGGTAREHEDAAIARNIQVARATPNGSGIGEHLKQIGSGLAEGVAGLADLPTNIERGISHLTGLPEPVGPSVSGAVAPYLAAPPTTATGRLERTAASGVPYGAAAAFTGGGSVIAESAIGAGSAVGGMYGGDVAEKAGLPRVVGELAGGAIAPGLAATGRTAVGAVQGSRAARQAVQSAEADVAAAKQASSALKDAADAKSTAHVAQVEIETGERLTQLEDAARAEHSAAAQVAVTAQETAAMRASVAGTAVEGDLLQMDPTGRATVLREAVRGNERAYVADRRALYENFMAREGDRPIPLEPLGVTAQDLVDRLQATGLAPDAASAEASRLLRVAGGDEGVHALPLRDADALRHELGQLFRKASGPTKERASRMFATFDQSVRSAVPPNVQQELDGLRTVYKRELNLYRNRLVKRVLDDTEQGRESAVQYTTQLLTKAWSPATAAEVRQTLAAAGTNTTAHEVLKDAVLRQALKRATRSGSVDWALFGRWLRNPDGLAPMFTQIVRDPRERARILAVADDAATAATRAQTAALAVPRPKPEWLTEAAQARTELVGVAKQTAKSIRAEAKQQARALRATAQDSLAAARSRIAPKEGYVLDALMLAGFESTAAIAHSIPGGIAAPIAVALLRWIRQGANRQFVREAARTTVESTGGRRLLQTLSAAASRFRTEGMPELSPVAADEPQRSAQ